MSYRDQITAGILAGGRGSRMGGQDKGLVEFQGRPLIEHVIAHVAPQVTHTLINANRNLERYAAYGFPVVQDRLEGHQGPLAGFSALLEATTTNWLATVPCDGPRLCDDHVHRLYTACQSAQAKIGVAHDGKRLQPVYALIWRELLPDLQLFLEDGGRKIDQWYARHAFVTVDYSDCREDFVNLNTPADREQLEVRQA